MCNEISRREATIASSVPVHAPSTKTEQHLTAVVGAEVASTSGRGEDKWAAAWAGVADTAQPYQPGARVEHLLAPRRMKLVKAVSEGLDMTEVRQ